MSTYNLSLLVAVDAAYEGMEKRTFLPMILLAGTHLPFLIGMVLLYWKLREQDGHSKGYSKLDTDQTD